MKTLRSLVTLISILEARSQQYGKADYITTRAQELVICAGSQSPANLSVAKESRDVTSSGGCIGASSRVNCIIDFILLERPVSDGNQFLSVGALRTLVPLRVPSPGGQSRMQRKNRERTGTPREQTGHRPQSPSSNCAAHRQTESLRHQDLVFDAAF